MKSKKDVYLVSLEMGDGKRIGGREGFEELMEPLGLCYVGGAIKSAGYGVKILQQHNHTDEEIINEIKNVNPKYVGFTSVSSIYPRVKNIAQKIKTENNITLLGGIHAQKNIRDVVGDFDYTFTGEGEKTIVDFLNNSENSIKLKQIKNLAFIDENNQFHYNGPSGRIENLDDISPLRENLLYDTYSLIPPSPKRTKNLGSIVTSRGCYHDCSFCTNKSTWGRNIKSHSTKYVIDELKKLKEKDVNYVFFHDEDFTANKTRLEEICNEIQKNNLDIDWIVMGRATDILKNNNEKQAKETLNMMKEAGCTQIGYGIESGDPDMLKHMNKGLNIKTAKKVLKLTYDTGIIPTAYFIFGNQNETEESVKNTINFIEDSHAIRIRIGHEYPFKGTRDRKIVDDNNLFISEKHKNFMNGDTQVIKLKNNFHERIPSGPDVARRIYQSENYKQKLNEFIKKTPHIDWDSWKKIIEN
ncbi:B12-binding domain-containing radical SAM protein [Candidatus Pacearchaeota archaeon]|nr:B12-binding domain-containing radical SAM protein [Candidatus Pacearchaeota archaeon]